MGGEEGSLTRGRSAMFPRCEKYSLWLDVQRRIQSMSEKQEYMNI
jgi:hypothetical protein